MRFVARRVRFVETRKVLWRAAGEGGGDGGAALPLYLATTANGHGIRVRVIALDAVQCLGSFAPREIDRQEPGRRFQTWLIGVSSATAPLLAALGGFAVMHFTVAAKTREIGVRTAVGARAANALALVIGDSARPAAAGIVVGALASTWVTGILSGLLFGVTPNDPLSFGGAAAVLAVVAFAACWLPAWRTARLNPVLALREE